MPSNVPVKQIKDYTGSEDIIGKGTPTTFDIYDDYAVHKDEAVTITAVHTYDINATPIINKTTDFKNNEVVNKAYVDNHSGTTYTAGDNILITNNEISAIDTIYTGGTGIEISNNNVISATGIIPTNYVTTDTDQTINGIKTFSNAPQTTADPSNNNDLVRLSYFNTNKGDKTTGTNHTGSLSINRANTDTNPGTNSIAIGNNVTASGNYSLAEGDNTTAKGETSHAEGKQTQANGTASHAEGYQTIANYDYTHAEGYHTSANGLYSHAEGYYTQTGRNYSHAEGYYTNASGNASHAEGGRYLTSDNKIISAPQAKGDYSHAEGTGTIATNKATHAEGWLTLAGGEGAHAEGTYYNKNLNNTETLDFGSRTYGRGGHSEGISTIAVANTAHTEGTMTSAILGGSHAEGHGNLTRVASCDSETKKITIQSKTIGPTVLDCLGIGYIVIVLHMDSLQYNINSVNEFTIATIDEDNNCITVNEDITNKVSVNDIIIINGYANGQYSHHEGRNNSITGNYSHAEGNLNIIKGKSSHAEGMDNRIYGDYSHIEGQGNIYTGNSGHVEGQFNYDQVIKIKRVGIPTSTIILESDTDLTQLITSKASDPYGQLKIIGKTIISASTGQETAFRFKSVETVSGTENQYICVITQFAYITDNILTEDNTECEIYNITTKSFFNNSENSGYVHILGIGSNADNRDNGFTVSTIGEAHAKKLSQEGADYAEYFEWLDGNPNNEDRVGQFVTLDGEKIKLANIEDDIIGIVSGAPGVIGNNPDWYWHGRYSKDKFGRLEYDTQEIIHDEDPEEIWTEVIKTPKINPSYDESVIYQRRSERPEWAAVGLLGQLVVIDDGTAQVNGYVSAVNGIATTSATKTNARVIARIDETTIKVLLK